MATISVTRFKNAVQRDIKHFGLVDSVKDYTLRAVNELTYFHVFRGMMIDQVTDKFMESAWNYECRFLTPSEMRALSRRPEYELSEKFIEAALEKGDQCYAILSDGFLASYAWYSSEPTLINDELKVRFDRQYIYMYNTFTYYDYRGQRLNAIGITLALNEYLKRDLKGIIFCVEENNHRSLRSVSRLGAQEFGRVIALKLSGRHVLYHSPGCRKRGLMMMTVV